MRERAPQTPALKRLTPTPKARPHSYSKAAQLQKAAEGEGSSSGGRGRVTLPSEAFAVPPEYSRGMSSMPLHEQVAIFRRELGLSKGTMREVVHEVATQLAVPVQEGRPLLELAQACMHALRGN